MHRAGQGGVVAGDAEGHAIGSECWCSGQQSCRAMGAYGHWLGLAKNLPKVLQGAAGAPKLVEGCGGCYIVNMNITMSHRDSVNRSNQAGHGPCETPQKFTCGDHSSSTELLQLPGEAGLWCLRCKALHTTTALLHN
jgi:hypothetical protein